MVLTPFDPICLLFSMGFWCSIFNVSKTKTFKLLISVLPYIPYTMRHLSDGQCSHFQNKCLDLTLVICCLFKSLIMHNSTQLTIQKVLYFQCAYSLYSILLISPPYSFQSWKLQSRENSRWNGKKRRVQKRQREKERKQKLRNNAPGLPSVTCSLLLVMYILGSL